MAKTKRTAARGIIRSYLDRHVAEEFETQWRALRDEHHALMNIRARWTRAYAEHCARIDDAEQRAVEADEREGTEKHVIGMWTILGLKAKSQRSKIRATGRWYKSLPPKERDVIVAQLPASKEALYAATTIAAPDLKRVLSASSINPESTTAEFRKVLGKATPQDRRRNAITQGFFSGSDGKRRRGAAEPAFRVIVICKTLDAVNALVAFAESTAHRYEIITEPV